ncbi:MazG nucleotide pyrophosphohydrolase domain-containing protein [Actinopolymorpha sp. B17G11]|uniref:MazG nucleotide pyrophosphohydrolase domain-containing protein n=1 Tax=Actinopolymorpha sp. B17G11 TaxID=3160861 RepID=UPI0032E48857
MTINDLTARAMRVHALYDELNHRQRGRTWNREEFVLGFMGDVGDLAKLTMAAEGARDMPGGRAALGHELADCLWSVLVLARLYDVDLDAEFEQMTAKLAASLTDRLREG